LLGNVAVIRSISQIISPPGIAKIHKQIKVNSHGLGSASFMGQHPNHGGGHQPTNLDLVSRTHGTQPPFA
jgi:hypothetical protein